MKKNTDYKTWWKGLNEEEQTKLCQKHFQGIPVESLMERSIKVMYHYENPETTTNTVTGGEFMLLLNEDADDEQKISLAKYINAFDEDLESDFLKVINLIVGESCQYGADYIKRIS